MLMPHWCRQEGLCHLALHIRWCRRLQSPGRQPCFYFILPLFFFFFSALTKEDSLPGLAAVIPFAFQHPLCVVPFLVRSNKDKQLTLPFNFMSCNIFLLSSIPSGWAVEILHLRHLFFFFFLMIPLVFIFILVSPSADVCLVLCRTKVLCESPYFHIILTCMLFSWLLSELQFVLPFPKLLDCVCR